MTPEARILELAKKATPGPWWQTDLPWNDTGTSVHAGDCDPHGGHTICDTDTSFTFCDEDSRDVANAAYIAALGTHGEAMARVVEALRKDTEDAALRCECSWDKDGAMEYLCATHAALAALDAQGAKE